VNSTWKVESLVPILMAGGFFVHGVNASRHILTDGSSRISDVLLWPVDLCLAVIMVFCGIVLIARHRAMSARFDLTSRPRRIGYWMITVYICASVPGHLLFLATGNTRYFDFWPWWYSLAILPVYVLMAAFFISLRPAAGSEVIADAVASRETVR
jgi:hypothetical protein